MHTEEDDVPITPKKKLDKGQSSSDTADSSDKSDPKKTDGEDPKPRIVLTFRSDKKNCNMKIVPNDEKHEESSPSPRRSTRSRHKWEWSEDAEMSISPKKEKNSSQSVSENDEASDSSHATPKRLTRGRSKESSDNVLANAIARKEKSYNEAAPGPTQRLSRRIKPTAKILANEELRIGLESQNNARLGLQSDKPEEGVRTRKSARSMPPEVDLTQVTPAMYLLDRNKKETRSSKAVEEEEAPEDVSDEAKQSPNTVMKLKHLCELGLKAINPETMEDEAVELDDEEDEGQEDEEYENEELEEDEDEIDDDSEVISKLLEADDDDDSDEDFSCSAEVSQAKRPRRSTRLCSSYGESELAPFTVDDDQKEEYNYRPSRKRSRRNEEVQVEEPEESKSNRDVLPRRAKNTDPWKRSESKTPDTQSVVNIPDDNDEPAGGDEGSEAACPEDEASTAATCFCETPSNIYAAPGELTEPVFCQAIETVDGVRVGCSHAAARDTGALRPLLRAGPRAPFVLTCTLHAAQLRAHMCCPNCGLFCTQAAVRHARPRRVGRCARALRAHVHAAQLRAHMCCPNCGLFCTQGTFYQCSLGHLFHLECGLPHSRWNRWSSDAKARPGCPHCGVGARRWTPRNSACRRVALRMDCSNKRIFLPDQREQCDAKARPGCPHCGVGARRWTPRNSGCRRVALRMDCSNKRIFLPDQREQCTPAYLGFTSLAKPQEEPMPLIPEDLLPSPPIDLKALCESNAAKCDPSRSPAQSLCDAILAGESIQELLPKIAKPQEEPMPLIPEDLLPSPPIDLKALCESNAAKCDPSRSPAQSLCDAILAGESIQQLLPKIAAARSTINEQITSLMGGTCVHAACKRADVAALYLLQYAGADLCAADNALRTPLVLAAQLLVEKSEKKSPIKSKKLKEKELKEDSKSKEETDEDTKEGIEEQEDSIASIEECKVGKASREDLMKFVRYLVAAGCDINIQGPEGMTALHIAAQGGDVELCTALLEAGDVSVDSRDLGGWTPLVWAAENDHVDVVRLLLSRGADATTRDAEGNGCVHWCALAGHARSLRLLLAAAPHAHAAPNAHKDTPLHVAARQGHYSCVVILLARGARTDVENSAGELPVEVCSGACQSVVSLNMQMALAAKGQLRRGKLLASDLSNGCETYALPCVNEVDDTPAPDDFTYVTDHVMPEPLNIDNTIQSMQGCECKDGDCSGGGCACCVLSVRRWSSALGRLPPAFPHHDPPMMFECNATCACNKRKCGNMVISRLQQRGSLFIRAEVFRTARAGWGLRAVSAVPRGSPVALYCGELLPLARADARPNDQYLFALDVKPDLQQQCGDKGTLCVDACVWGSAARFINHSCAPNLAPLRVFTRARDLAAPVVALYAMRDVAAGEELTFDYGDKFWSVKSKWMKCECGSPECRYPVKSTEADA